MLSFWCVLVFFLFSFKEYLFFCLLGVVLVFMHLLYDGGFYFGALDFDWSYGSSLIVLSLWLMVLAFLVKIPKKFDTIYLGCITSVVCFCCFCFSCSSWMVYFIFFELTFFPIGLMIVMWGYNRERVSSLIYMMTYSMFGASFHILGLMMVKFSYGSLSNLGVLSSCVSSVQECLIWWGFFIFLFLIKSPLFLSHGWLTKAHVEAPTSASMLLAGILLKLGVYGLFLCSRMWWPPSFFLIGVQSLGVFGCLLCAISCCRSQNLKLMIAMSSVCHMSLSLGFFFCGSEVSFDLVLLNCIAHGLCASGLFSWAGGQFYRSSTQNMMSLSGQRLLFWEVGMSVLCILMLNCGIPPFMSFWVEFFGISCLILKWPVLWLFLALISVSVLCFSCLIGINVCFGVNSDFLVFGSRWSDVEILGLILHWVPSMLFFFFSSSLFF